jgi:putative nucleotidyltransferase with HDIG domain
MNESSIHPRREFQRRVQAAPPPPAASPHFGRFIAAVIAIGFAIVAYSVYELPTVPYPLGWVALAVLSIVASAFPVQVPGVPVYFSISDTFFITSALLFGPAPAAVTIAVDSLVASWRRRNDLQQVLFNCTSAAIALWCGATFYYLRSGHEPLALTWGTGGMTEIGPLAILALAYFALNSGLTACAIGLSKGIPIFPFWRQHFAVIAVNYTAAGSAAFFLVLLLRSVGPTAFAAALPIIFVCYIAMQSRLGRMVDAQRHVRKLNELYMSTIGAFSTAIEAKDGVTSDHVHRVRAYAMGLARALGYTDQETLQALEAASLLHDTGKLAVPEHILNKPGRLTPAEFETMKTHVDVGADILSSIDFPYPVVPIVRAHHENWDGTGYPRRLKGEDIPIGARILAVVDCFDALTSDRPYRPAMSEAQAVDIIVERRGTMYDPHVVDTFLSVYRDIAPTGQQQPALASALRRIRKIHQPPQQNVAAPGRPTEVAPFADASEELLAFVSLARIVSQTPSIRDIGMLAWGHMRHIAAGASVAIFTVDASRGALVAQFTAGPSAERLNGLTMAVAQRVSGWVAANWQPMFNADAHLDLEQATELRFAMSLPLIVEGRLVAVVTLYASDAFTEVQMRRMEIIAPHFAASLQSLDMDRIRNSGTALRLDVDQVRNAGSELRVVARR